MRKLWVLVIVAQGEMAQSRHTTLAQCLKEVERATGCTPEAPLKANRMDPVSIFMTHLEYQ